MLDVHEPHEPIHGWRDFLLHLFTITIGLLIALSLEGLVEWQHHRHLVHEAEASLHAEIKSNAQSISGIGKDIEAQEAMLQHDIVVLNMAIAHRDISKEHMSVAYHLTEADDVSWRTAQSTGALALMPYSSAQEYAQIYATQAAFESAERQAVRDAILSVAPFAGEKDKAGPTPEQAAAIKEHIQVLLGQLSFIQSFVQALDREYTKFLTAHP